MGNDRIFRIGKPLVLSNVSAIKRSDNVLTVSGGKVLRLSLDSNVKKNSNSLITSGAVYDAISKVEAGDNSAGSGAAPSVPSWQATMVVDNYTDKSLELRSSGATYTSEIYTDEVTGRLLLNVETNNRVESNGDVVAYGDGASPGGSWWDDIPVDGVTIHLNGSGDLEVIGGGVSTWDDLTDTPSTKVSNKWVKVNAGATALEYVDAPVTTVSWGDIIGTISNQTDLQNALNGKADSSLLSGYLPLIGGTLTGKLIVDDVDDIIKLTYAAGTAGYIQGVKDGNDKWFIGNGSPSNSDLYLYNYQANKMYFGTDSSLRMVIDGSGNVGIGTTTPNANNKLEVVGFGWFGKSADARPGIVDTTTFNNAGGIFIGDGGMIVDNNNTALNISSRTNLKFFVNEGSGAATEAMVIDTSGNVSAKGDVIAYAT